MGSKFANIQVKCSDLEAVRDVLPDFVSRIVSDGWVTAVREGLRWGEAQGAAKRASRVLPCPVVSTEYFDDDYVEFAVFLAGKRAARFVPAAYEGFPRVPGKPAAWREALGLSEEDEKSLKTVFRETSPETCVRLLEDVLGCPLWAEEEFADRLQAPTGDFLRAYLAQKDAESRIVNRTRLRLLDELLCSRAVTAGQNALVWRDGLNGPAAFYQARDGRLCRLFDVPPTISDRIPLPIPPEGEPDTLFPVYVQRPEGETVYTLDREGRLLDEVFLPGMTQKQCLSIEPEHILAGGVCRNVRTHEDRWDMGIRDTAYGLLAPLSFPDGRLCWCYDVTKRRDLMTTESFLLTAAPDGTDRREMRLSGVYHWQRPVLWGDKLLLGVEQTLHCYDSALRPLWSMELGRNVYQSGQAAVDGDTLYMSVSYDSFTAIDLAERRVIAGRELGESEVVLLVGVLPDLGPVVTNGGSNLQVWDRELKPVSRHRLRGEFRHIFRQDGRTLLLAFSQDGENSCLRLYELKG